MPQITILLKERRNKYTSLKSFTDHEQLQQQHQQKQQALDPLSEEPAGEPGGGVSRPRAPVVLPVRLLCGVFSRPSVSVPEDGPWEEEILLICIQKRASWSLLSLHFYKQRRGNEQVDTLYIFYIF